MATEKYKELFTFSNTLLKNEHERFNRADAKAANYLSVITLLIGIEGAFGKEILKGLIPPATLSQWLLLNVAIVSFLMLVATWFVIFRTLRIHALKWPPLNQEMIEFFNDQKEINIYYHLARANAQAWKENVEITNKKAKALFYGYRMIIGTVCLFVIFSAMYFAQAWNSIPVVNQDQKMHQSTNPPNEPKDHQPAPATPSAESRPSNEIEPEAMLKPDALVKAPEYIQLANERDNPQP